METKTVEHGNISVQKWIHYFKTAQDLIGPVKRQANLN